MRFDADDLRKAKALRKYHTAKNQKHIKALSIAAITGLAFCTVNTQKANAVEPTLGINSSYNLTAATADDYDFASIDKNGNAVYYKYALKNSDTPPDSQNVHWTKENTDQWYEPEFTLDPETMNGEGIFSVETINKNGDYAQKAFSYTYTNDGKTIGSLGELSGDVQNSIYPSNHNGVQNYSDGNYNINADFIQNNGEPQGGAIDNEGKLNNISGTFIQNYLEGNTTSYGGAISNSGKINTVTGTFIQNSANAGGSDGGAIYNTGDINKINANFIGNNAHTRGVIEYPGIIPYNPKNMECGGAIKNEGGHIGSIEGNFYYNTYRSRIYNDLATGGAIANTGKIDSVNANFVGNNLIGNSNSKGGAIYNSNHPLISYETTEPIEVSPKSIAPLNTTLQGAQNNIPAEITEIKGSFTDNTVYSRDLAQGGAVANDGKINTIEADFVNNGAMAEGSGSYAKGGALFNSGEIKTVKGDFLNNFATGSAADGGAIYNSNSGRIDNIFGNFLGNMAFSNGRVGKTTLDCGGAIKNDGGYVGTVKGNFIDNQYTSAATDVAAAGAYYNSGTTEKIHANFNNNVVSGYDAKGGGLYNFKNSTIKEVKGDFIGNAAKGYNFKQGGAVYNNGTINTLEGNFIGNYTEKYTPDFDNLPFNPGGDKCDCGGAIYNDKNGVIDKVSGTFENNRDISVDNIATGGAIANAGQINIINSNFNNNYAQSESNAAYGGAIYNAVARPESLEDEVLAMAVAQSRGYNSVEDWYTDWGYSSLEECIANSPFSSIQEIADNFGVAPEDVLNNNLNITVIDDDGSVIAIVYLPGERGGSETRTKEEFAKYMGQNTYTDIESAIAAANNVYGEDWHIYSSAEQTTINEIKPVNIVNTSFTNNYVKAPNGEAHGGAIYTKTELNIEAKNGYKSKISGNYVEDRNGKRQEGIYVAAPVPLTLNANTKGKIVVSDQINGVDGYTLAVTGDKTGVVKINNDVKAEKIKEADPGPFKISHTPTEKNTEVLEEKLPPEETPQTDLGIANITLDKTMLHLAKRDNVLDGNNLTLNSGTFNMVNNQVGISALNNMTVKGNTNFVADVDLAKSEMDRFTAKEYGQHTGKLNVVGMNLLSDATEKTTDIYFAEQGLKDHVVSKVGTIGKDTKNKWQTKAFAPIYKYDVTYENRDDAGYFVFKRQASGSGEGGELVPISVDFNPAVLASPVAAQAGANATMNQVLNFAFEHGDTFMNNTSMDRFAMTHENVYALSTDFNENLSYTDLSHENKSVWVKPYSVFEKIDLKNGPKVDTISYGTLVGFDSNIHKMKKGWYNVGTAYIGYNGSQIDYKGVDASMNGGLLGLTETFYKGNFWTAITATAGAGVAEAHTMYGKDDMTMLMAGIGSKTGYNFEFADGKFIIQPRMFISYSMINTFDYTNAAGVRIDSDPMHTIQLNPAIKFIGNTKNGWQPYASVGMMWNLLNETETTANGVKLPEMHTKPYVEYGVGIQKLWNDKYSAYGQAMVRNGGRTGVALTLGFRMALGEDGKPIERTQNTPDNTTKTNKVGYLK